MHTIGDVKRMHFSGNLVRGMKYAETPRWRKWFPRFCIRVGGVLGVW